MRAPPRKRYWAQGGIAGVLGNDDTVAHHVEDTLVAGAGLCSRDVTEFVVSRSRDAISWLIDSGVPDPMLRHTVLVVSAAADAPVRRTDRNLP